MKNSRRLKRRSFTLLEILISMGLAALLFGLLFTTYGQVMVLQRESDKTRQEAFGLRYLQSRLSDVLYRAVQRDKPGFNFFTEQGSGEFLGKSLVFTYVNEYACGPLFANEVIGRLYVSRDQELCLATWPIPDKTEGGQAPMRKEVLLSGVDELEFSFYYPLTPEGHSKTVASLSAERQPPAEILMDWDRYFDRLPAIVRITVKRPAGSIELAFPLPNARETIVYTESSP